MPNVSPVKFNKQLNLRVDDEVREAIEDLRRLRNPIPSVGDVVREAVLEKHRREVKVPARKK
jgi:hypothetical protein